MIGLNCSTWRLRIASCSAGEEPTGSAPTSRRRFAGSRGFTAQGPSLFLGAVTRRGDFLLQAVDHLARCLRRDEKAVPAVGFQERKAELARRRYLGQVGDAFRGIGGERLDLARLDVGERG